MFKWKVNGLGAGLGSRKKSHSSLSSSSNSVGKLNNNSSTESTTTNIESKNNKNKEINSKKEMKKKSIENEIIMAADQSVAWPKPPNQGGQSKGFRLFSTQTGAKETQPKSEKISHTQESNPISPEQIMPQVGQRLALGCNNSTTSIPQNVTKTYQENGEHIYNGSNLQEQPIKSINSHVQPPPMLPIKPGWRPPKDLAFANDSPYVPTQHRSVSNVKQLHHGLQSGEHQFAGSKQNMAHWSSHGYLAKTTEYPNPVTPSGYIAQNKPASMIIRDSPQSLPTTSANENEQKFLSVRGYTDFQHKHNDGCPVMPENKYFSIDAKYHSIKHLPTELRLKLQERLNATSAKESTSTTPVYQHPPRPKNVEQSGTDDKKSSPFNGDKTVVSSSAATWFEWTQQLQAYVAWINSQLRKRAELKHVQDLRTDLQSGEVLAQLVEIISGEKILGIHYNPDSFYEMKENLEIILQFMASKKIRMHPITSKEILEGNLKSIMRLILALAAHYKPQSVKHHSDQANVNVISPSSNISPTKNHPSRPECKEINNNVPSMPKNENAKTILTTKSTSDCSVRNILNYKEQHKSFDQNGESTRKNSQILEIFSPESTNTASHDAKSMETQTESSMIRSSSFVSRQRENSFIRTASGRKLPQIPSQMTSVHPQSAANEQVPCDKPIKSFNTDDEERRNKRPKALDFWETLETGESKNDFRYNTIHRMSLSRRRELPQAPNLITNSMDSSFCNINHHGVREGSLQSLDDEEDECAVTEQNILPPPVSARGEVEGSSDHNSPPTSVIQGGRGGEEGSNEVEEISTKFDWRIQREDGNNSLNKWSMDINKKAKDEHGGSSYDILLQDLSQAKRQLIELHQLVEQGGQTSSFITDASANGTESNVISSEYAQLKRNLVRATIAKQNLEAERVELLRRISALEASVNSQTMIGLSLDCVSGTTKKGVGSTPQTNGCRQSYEGDLVIAREAITNLRTSFREADPNQHILDTLEQCISVIIEKIQPLDRSPECKESEQLHDESDERCFANGSRYQSAPTSITKILYFTNRSVTPFMTSINKRIGEVTLRDFKGLFDRPGFFRFHFKNVDTEFGMVKEEIDNEDAILPGSDGKIIVWVEED